MESTVTGDDAVYTPAPGRHDRFLHVEDVAARLGCSTRSVHELTRNDRIPHRVMPYGRRCLFTEEHLAAWLDGAELERVNLAGGGRVVRPVA